MKLTTVLGSCDNNPHYYKFIPFQIWFWAKFGIKFIAVFIGNNIPIELLPFKDNIHLWNYTPHLTSSFVGQNLRIYYPALLKGLSDDELVMITDMDMLPCKPDIFTQGLEQFKKDDFLTWHPVLWDAKEIFMWYNAAHPDTWGNIFKVNSIEDIIQRLNETHVTGGKYAPAQEHWFIDQHTMFNVLINHPSLKQLNRIPKRMANVNVLTNGNKHMITMFDDVHFHRSFMQNEHLIMEALSQLEIAFPTEQKRIR